MDDILNGGALLDLLDPGNLTPVLDERVIVTLFALMGLFFGLLLVSIQRKPKVDVITRASLINPKQTDQWRQTVTPVSTQVTLAVLIIGGVIPGAAVTFTLGPIIGIPLGLLGAWLLPTGLVSSRRGRWAAEMDEGALSLLQLLYLNYFETSSIS